MVFDTDMFIWVQRGNAKACKLMERESERFLSMYTYMELLQCAQNKTQHMNTRKFLAEFDFNILPLTENIGHRASVYIEEYSLASNLRAGDALIAATAIENTMILCTSNTKDFKKIHDLELCPFKP